MAGKTHTDLIRELGYNLVSLEAQVVTLQGAFLELKAEHLKTVEALQTTATQLSVLQARFEDARKAHEESARQRWLLWVAAWGSVLTLLANLALAYLRR